jgi:hypothetical protein
MAKISDEKLAKVEAVRLMTDCTGRHAEDVAAETGLTVNQVRTAMASANAMFQAQLSDAREIGAMREMHRINWVETEAMGAWPQSQTDKQPGGTPALLKIILECSKQRVDLLGLIPKERGGTSEAVSAELAVASAVKVFIKLVAPTGFRTRTFDAAETIRVARLFESDLRDALGIGPAPVEIDAQGGQAGDGEQPEGEEPPVGPESQP